jgi:RNA 3'-terminal phosphate cyclase (ATP)
VFDFDLTSGMAPTLVLQTLVPVLAQAQTDSRLSVVGGTHVPGRPSFHFLERHWASLAAATGLSVRLSLVKAAFQSKGAGEIQAVVSPRRDSLPLVAEKRGALVAIRAVGGASRTRGDALGRLRDAAQRCFWERRRLEPTWEVVELAATSPGFFGQIDLVFESGRACLDVLGTRSIRPEVAGERLAGACLRFLDGEGAVDRYVADQLIVPMVASGRGGRVSTEVVTDRLEAAAETAELFGFKTRLWGVRGGPGGVEVERS